MIGKITLFLLLSIFSSALSAQCLTAPSIDSLDQPTCTNQFGVVFLSGLPSTGWTVNSVPAGFTQSGVGTIAAITGLTPGTAFSFTYTNPSVPCTSPATFVININAVPSVPATPIAGQVTQPTCVLATGAVAISNLPSTGGWTITATGNSPVSTSTLNGVGTTTSFSGLPLNSYTFTVTSLSTGCTSASSNTVFVNPPINPATPIVGAILQPNCASPTGSVSLSGLPAVGSWVLHILPGNTTQNGTGTTAVVPNLTASTSYTFYVVNAASCSSAVSAPAVISPTLSIPSIPSAILTQPTCPIPTGTLNVTSPLGASFVYAVNGGAYQAAPTFAGLTGGNYTLSVQNSVSGCITQNPSAYIINPTPVAPVISILYVDSVSCFGLSNGGAAVQIDSLGTPPFVFSWSPMGGTNDTVTGLPIGNYNIVVVDAANCVVVQGFSIFQPTALSIVGDSTPIDCASGVLGTMDVTVSGGTGAYNYLWTNGNTTDSISNLNIGTYGVNVSDANGCQIGFSAQIDIVNALLVAIQPSDTTINPGGTFSANVNVGNSYLWTPSQGLSCTNCPNPIITPDTTTLYYVDVADANGCQGQDSMLVTVKLLCGDFFVPTIFSPNGTGPSENNILKVMGKEVCVKDFSFMIFDRWGEKVFEGTDISQSWDGFYKGKPMQMGNFVFDLNIQMYDDTIIHKSGSLTLVR